MNPVPRASPARDRRPINLARLLVYEQVAAGRGDATALIADGRPVSYRALEADVNRVGRALVARGVGPGDRVLLRLPNSARLACAWLATQKIGATAVTTPVGLRPRELVFVMRDASPALCLVESDHAWEIDDARGQLAGAPDVLLSSEIGPDDRPLESYCHAGPGEPPALIAYTADLRGDPKGACHYSGPMIAATEAYANGVLGLSADDVVGGGVPLSFTYGLGALLVFPLRAGATAVLDERFNAEQLLQRIADHRITVLFGTATCYRLLLRIPSFEQRWDLRSLRVAVSAGEPLEPEVTSEWMRRTGVDLVDGFGTTEMFHIFLSARPGQIVPGATGTPVPGYDVRLLDERFSDVPVETPGRLAVRGPTRCEYWNAPDAEPAPVNEGWHLTGDVMRQDRHGQYWFLRRTDALIVSAGYNIAPAEIESVLARHPAVRDVTVVGVPDPVRHRIPKAIVRVRPEDAADPGLVASLHAHAQRELAAFKCPRAYEIKR